MDRSPDTTTTPDTTDDLDAHLVTATWRLSTTVEATAEQIARWRAGELVPEIADQLGSCFPAELVDWT